MMRKLIKVALYGLTAVLTFGVTAVFAAKTMSLGSVASTITDNFSNLTQFITAGSYIAGVGFSVGAIMSFKQHKDNPTQVTIGKPISLLAIAAALLFFPTVLGVSGQTIFGKAAETAGPSGTIFSTN